MIKYLVAICLVLSTLSHNEYPRRYNNPNNQLRNWHSLNWQGGSLGRRSRNIVDQWNIPGDDVRWHHNRNTRNLSYNQDMRKNTWNNGWNGNWNQNSWNKQDYWI